MAHNTQHNSVKLAFGEKTRLRWVLWRLWYHNETIVGHLSHGWEGIGGKGLWLWHPEVHEPRHGGERDCCPRLSLLKNGTFVESSLACSTPALTAEVVLSHQLSLQVESTWSRLVTTAPATRCLVSPAMAHCWWTSHFSCVHSFTQGSLDYRVRPDLPVSNWIFSIYLCVRVRVILGMQTINRLSINCR